MCRLFMISWIMFAALVRLLSVKTGRIRKSVLIPEIPTPIHRVV